MPFGHSQIEGHPAVMNPASTTAFLCGADMNPETIRRRPGFANARFTGIGSIAASDIPALPTTLDRVWGIVIEGVEQAEGPVVGIQRRDGSMTSGVLVTGECDLGDLETVVNEARYWELPVAWWQSLKRT
jgi:hypothetical protein